MNLEELKTFLAVVEAGSLIAASRRLNVTQSTVTARINALEDEIGQKLLHRHKSGAELTSPGFKFKRYAELMVQLWRQARYEVSLPKGFVGVCNLGLDFDLWDDAGRIFLDFVRGEAPGVALAVWPGEQRQLDRWLSIGLIDVALCYAPQSGEVSPPAFSSTMNSSWSPTRRGRRPTLVHPMSLSIMARNSGAFMPRPIRAIRHRR